MQDEVVFKFDQGAFFSGSLEYTITRKDGNYHFDGYFYNDFVNMSPVSFDVTYEEIEELLEAIKPAHRWKRKYETLFDVYDGFGYTLISRFDSCRVNSEGYECYPMNYVSVITNLQEKIEDLCLKKDPDHYDHKGRAERIKLALAVK